MTRVTKRGSKKPSRSRAARRRSFRVRSPRRRSGISGRIGWPAVSVMAAAILVGFLLVLGNSDDSPYSVQDTLPHVVSDFGANARVADIRVNGANDILYEIMATNGLVHVRDYRLSYVRLQHSGRTHYRHVVNFVRDATALDLRNAQVRLGDIPSGVVAKVFARLRFAPDAASATLEGKTWTLSSDTSVFNRYQARYDGTRLHQTQSRATLFSPPSLSLPATSPSGSPQASGAVPPSAAPHILSADRLIACVRGAKGDVTKLVACQQRYAQ
jgi:hypothetical protein